MINIMKYKIVAFTDNLPIEGRIVKEFNELILTYRLTMDELIGYFAEKYELVEGRVRKILKDVEVKLHTSENEEESYIKPREIEINKWLSMTALREDSEKWYREHVVLSGPFAKARPIMSLARVMKGQNPFGVNIFGWMLPQTPVRLGTTTVDIDGKSIEIPLLDSTRVTIDGKEGVYDVFNSNDYVGLRCHPRVMAAALRAIMHFGNGTGGSRMISGTTPEHIELERVIAEFEGTEDAIVFNTGYDTNLAMSSVFFGKGAVIFSDSFNHASIIDGTRLSGAQVEVFQHNDIDDLRRVIEEFIRKYGKKALSQALLFVESVYSMDGDIAKLQEMVEIAKKYGLVVGVDEAHSTFVLGPTGKGITEIQDISHGKIDLLMGTLSKAVGAEGGFIAARRQIVEAFKLLSRQFWFSTAQTAASFAGAAESFRVIKDEKWRVEKVQSKSTRVRAALREMGYDLALSATQIIPVIIGDQQKTAMMSYILQSHNILAGAIFAPAVPEGQERIRLSISADHTDAQIAKLITVFEDAKKEMGM